MRQMILTMLILFAVVCLGAAQSADPTATANADWGATFTAEARQHLKTTPTLGPTPTIEGFLHHIWEGSFTPVPPTPGPSPTSGFWARRTQRAVERATRRWLPVTATPSPTLRPGEPTWTPGPIDYWQTGAIHTVGEGIPDINAAATALHQMVHSPAATPAFSSGCELPPRDRAHAAVCDAYKAAYRLRYGNPCRHNDEGEAVCLH